MADIKLADLTKCGRIGQGEISKSRVWQAKRKGTDELYALKTTSTFKKFSEKDIDIDFKPLLQSTNNNIVKHHRIICGETDGFPDLSFVMELCDADLQKVINFCITSDKKDVLQNLAWPFAEQMGIATEYLLDKNIIHRDIKPSSVLVHGIGRDDKKWIEKLGGTVDVTFKLAGFHHLKQLTCDLVKEQNMTIQGHSIYIAPEVRLGPRIPSREPSTPNKLTTTYNALADAWSLGLIILELCISQTPMSAQDVKFLDNDLKDVNDPRLKQIIRELLVFDHKKRSFLHWELSKLKQANEITPEQALRKSRQEKGLCYDLPERPFYGNVLILNNRKFERDCLSTRVGSDVDVKRLEDCFRTKHRMDVKTVEDLKSDGMETEIKNFLNRRDLVNAFIFLMSHGDSGEVFGADGVTLSVNKVLDMMSSTECRHLDHKFKFLAINACRGGDLHTSDDGKPKQQIDVAKQSDTIVVFSTLDSFASLRNKTNGSRFIEAITEVFIDKALTNDYEIRDLLDEAHIILASKKRHATVKENGREKVVNNIIQGTEYRVFGMSKKFYFQRR